ncbi:MAG: hypothetical protein Sylvanvirus9_13 [Sylvanvirus sp.]|uniref:Uncharacterized protein n=1 Tax=Sylvanvirus sp. TaxID=2487774 RepID=A0A3G5AKI1_9VIRU|nr:MAG: hypothetical protein Sylvanvirus9_13 [Sylvanvirus sp.]
MLRSLFPPEMTSGFTKSLNPSSNSNGSFTFLKQRQQHIDSISKEWLKREERPISSNLKYKIVGSTGTSYVVPIPQLDQYDEDLRQYNALSPIVRRQTIHPQLRYINGPVIMMNKHQRELQRQGRLPGCISNCSVLPHGQGKRRFGGVQFADPNLIMNELNGSTSRQGHK